MINALKLRETPTKGKATAVLTGDRRDHLKDLLVQKLLKSLQDRKFKSEKGLGKRTSRLLDEVMLKKFIEEEIESSFFSGKLKFNNSPNLT